MFRVGSMTRQVPGYRIEGIRLFHSGLYRLRPQLVGNFNDAKGAISEAVKRCGDDHVNAPKTVPNFEAIKSKAEIEGALVTERPDLVDGYQRMCTIWYRVMKSYLVFVKDGIQNVWKTRRELSATVYRRRNPYYIYDNGLGKNDRATGSSEDKKLALKPSSLDKMVSEMAVAIRCEQNVQGEKMWVFSNRQLIQITRSQFQQMIRNSYDFPRLPGFALLFMLIEELTLLVCYVSPYITPTTCVFPKMMPRYFSRCVSAQKTLKDLRQARSRQETASLNPFDMSAKEARALSELLMVNAYFKTASYLNSTQFVRQSLLQRYKEITVDNYLILRDGGVDAMSETELFESCLRRGLIDFGRLVVDQKFNRDQMRLDLKTFIVDFDDRRNQIGLLGLYITS